MNFKNFLVIANILILFAFPITSFANSSEISTLSPACILIDADSGKILYEKNARTKLYPASTTKIMTAILTIEKCNLNDTAIVNETAITKELIPDGYSRANLKAGEVFTIEQLLNCLLIPSANDAANVLAEHISGSIDKFCSLMNKKAIDIGCENTHFVNPNGVHNENHYSTAYDLSLIAKYAMRNNTFREFVCKTSCSIPPTDIYPKDDRKFNTTNELLRNKDGNNYYYEYANGIKTGYTTVAKNCIVASAKKDDYEFIAVILGATQKNSNESTRAIDCINLFNYAINNYKDKKFLSKDSLLKQIEIDTGSASDSKKQTLNIVPENDIIIRTLTSIEDVTPVISINDNLKAPILSGEIVGKIEYEVDGIKYSTNLIADNNVLNSLSIQYIFDFLLILLIVIILFTIFNHRRKKHNQNSNYSFDFKRFY